MNSPVTRRTWILLGLIFVLALALDAWFYTGFFASDDTEYIYGAHNLVAEAVGAVPVDLQPGLGNSRLGMTVPGAVVYWLSGGSIDAIAWFHVLYHLGLVGLAFALGRRLRDDSTGLVAALLVAGNPLFFLYAGAFLPDNATAFWLALAMLVLETMRRRASAALSPARAFAGYFAAGLALGMAYACKETALIMTVPAAVWVISAAPRLRDPVWIRNGGFLAAGLLALVAVEAIGLRLIMGEWVWRLGIVEGSGDLLSQRMAEQGVTPFERFGFAHEYRLEPFVPLSLWLVVTGAVGYAVTRGRSVALMAFFWWPLLYITIGSTSFSAYRPPSLQTRYYSIVVLPAMLMVATVASIALRRWSAWQRRRSRPGAALGRRAASALLVIALLLMIGAEADLNATRAGNLYRATMVRSFVAAYDHARAECPPYPVVLSWYYRRRMTPVFLPRAPGDVQTGAPLSQWHPPEPPFLYIASTTQDSEARLSAEHGEVAVQTRTEVRAPATRGELLAYQLRQLFGLVPAPAMARTPEKASLVYLVTRPDQPALGCRAAASREAPWFALQPGPRITLLGDGTFVSWPDDERFYIQLFDSSSYQRPPKLPSARLANRPRAVTLELEFRLTRGERVRAVVHVYGYRDRGEPVRVTESVMLEAGAAFTRVPVVLHSDQPMGWYRVRVLLDPSAPGGLHIRPRPVVETSPPGPGPGG